MLAPIPSNRAAGNRISANRFAEDCVLAGHLAGNRSAGRSPAGGAFGGGGHASRSPLGRRVARVIPLLVVSVLATATARAADDLRTPEYDLIFGSSRGRAATPDIPAALEGPIDPDTYRLVPGDLLLLEIGGETDRSWRLAISAEGDLLIPGVAPIRASGKCLTEVVGIVGDALSKRYPGMPISLHLMQLGAFRVPVTGLVANPGIIVAHAYDRISTAIAAGGGPLPGGSLRRIVVKQADGTERECDLVRFALQGTLDQNPAVVPGSSIQVPPARDHVRVTGAVRGLPGPDRDLVPNAGSRIPENPNVLLEWKDGDTAAFDLDRAGGLSEEASGEVLLIRGEARRLFHAAGADSIRLQSGDLLEAAMRERWVYVNGAVRFPGPYPYLPSLSAADYVRIAGGPTEIGRGNGWSIRLPKTGEKFEIGKEEFVPPGATVWVPERWTYKTSTLLAPISGITALIISLVALRR